MAAAAASFSDDFIREILVRLEDAADLFRCAVTCKRWRRLVVKASFLRRRRWPDHTSSSFFSGFFLWNSIRRGGGCRWSGTATFVPTPRSVLGSSDHGSLEPFLPGLPANAMPLTTRHGLVLVRLHTPNLPSTDVGLAVCNPITGACDKLPRLYCNWDFAKSGYAILTGEDCSSDATRRPLAPPPGYSAFFKVLIIGSDNHIDHGPNNLYRYTSGEPAWSTPTKFVFGAGEEWNYCLPLMHPRAVVWRGTAHWLGRGFTSYDYDESWHTIDVDAETYDVSLTRVTFRDRPMESFFGPELAIAAGKELSLFYLMRKGSKLVRWTRQDQDGGPIVWRIGTVVELQPPVQRCMASHFIMLGENGGMLLVKDSDGNVYNADYETGKMEKFASLNKINRQRVVPFEMDWPAFFVSRLGTRELDR